MSSLSAAMVCGSFVVMAISNYLAQKKFFGGKDNKELSDTHPTYLSPDGFTFAIWGIIYLLELVMVLAQLFAWSPQSKVSVDAVFEQKCLITGLDLRQRLVIAFIANSMWLPVFNNECFFAALAIMGIYLGFLLSATLDLSSATAGFPLTNAVLSSGVAMNASWIVVAFSLSIFFCAGELGWKDKHGVAGSVPAAIAVIVLVCSIGCARAVLECELAWAFVAAWALRGIYRMQTIEDAIRFPPTALNETLASVALWASRAVILAMVLGTAKALLFRSAKPSGAVGFSSSAMPLLSNHSD